ncbi:MAG: tRNA pseudouridine(54/55) synthase Pus10 [Candidatus Micrarchaeia archaeon]
MTRKGVKIVQGDQCYICKGLLDRIRGVAERVLTKLETADAEYKTFLIGSRMPKDMATREEEVWERIGLGRECIKTEINREIGKLIEDRCRFRYDPNPDIRAIYDISSGIVDIEITPIYIFGKYRKLKRGIRQTIKEGSKEESVEGFIIPTLVKAARGEKGFFHGHGREDIDALMLGNGRPFVAEIVGPRIRELDLHNLAREINRRAKGKVEVLGLRPVTQGMVEDIKRAKFDKTYRALVELDNPIERKNLEKIAKRCVVLQRTPTRVLSRRVDIVRKRKVKEIKARLIDSKHIELTLTTESGTYVKEFISGDGGRTEPSIASMLGYSAKCKELNVLRVHSEWYEDFW